MNNAPTINRDAIFCLPCPKSTKSSILDYAEKLVGILDKKIKCLCICGSLARKCFHPGSSDIDIIVVTSEPCAESCVSSILGVHQQTGIPIDAFFVTIEQLDAGVFPTPIDFVVKPVSGAKVIRLASGSNDFLLQRQDAYEAGITVIGPTRGKIFKPVPWILLSQCLEHISQHAVERFKYPVLVLCRIVYAHKHREMGSKKVAGEWALSVLPKQWMPIIEESLESYAQGSNTCNLSREELIHFAKYSRELVRPS